MAVATTAKAVAELSGAGLDARTIARLRIDLSDGPLAAGTVVVLDEISQTPTGEVEAVLAAVDACPGGQLVGAGRPPPIPAGGGGRDRRPPGPARHRRADPGGPADGQPPPGRRRRPGSPRRAAPGRPGRVPAARAEHGWEHEHASPGETREAHGGRGVRRHRPLRSRPGGGAGRVPWRRRGPGRPRPGPPGRQRRALRSGHDGPGMGQRP